MRALLTIDLAAIRANWRALAERVAPAECGAVVKADAYGLGLDRVAPALRRAGAGTFFTALIEEADAAREAVGPGPAIYAFNGAATTPEFALAAARGLRPLLNDPGQVAAARAFAAEAGRPTSCGLQLDSGMNRLGLEPAELAAILDDPQGLEGLEVALVMSHLACADEAGHPMNAAQREAFEAMTGHPRLAGIPRSLSATGGALLGADYAYDLVRPGVGLYGGHPFAEARPVVAVQAPVIQVRDVSEGETVGYGADWRAPRPSRVATVAAGYADGLIRAMGGRAAARWRGRALPLIGRVSMDLIALDATEAPELVPGEAVALLDAAQGVDALAEAAGTIGYEILTSLGARYARRYEAG